MPRRHLGWAPWIIACFALGCACSPADSSSARSSTAPLATSAAAPKPSVSASTTATAAAASAVAPAPTPPSMPAAVTQCEATGKHYGGFAPSVEDLVAADKALPDAVCLKRDIASAAIRACAAKTGQTTLLISTDKLGENKAGCQVTITGAEWQGRRFVVFFDLHRDSATFFGGATVVELQGDKARVYLDTSTKHAELCPSTATTGKPPKPEDLPPGWDALPKDLQAFLCSGGG
ncbi:MAG: hypothetical protein JNL21_36240 [Myxococcales bacterium]|nr:hypothetical protein [Myxococcales bacterium]